MNKADRVQFPGHVPDRDQNRDLLRMGGIVTDRLQRNDGAITRLA